MRKILIGAAIFAGVLSCVNDADCLGKKSTSRLRLTPLSSVNRASTPPRVPQQQIQPGQQVVPNDKVSNTGQPTVSQQPVANNVVSSAAKRYTMSSATKPNQPLTTNEGFDNPLRYSEQTVGSPKKYSGTLQRSKDKKEVNAEVLTVLPNIETEAKNLQEVARKAKSSAKSFDTAWKNVVEDLKNNPLRGTYAANVGTHKNEADDYNNTVHYYRFAGDAVETIESALKTLAGIGDKETDKSELADECIKKLNATLGVMRHQAGIKNTEDNTNVTTKKGAYSFEDYVRLMKEKADEEKKQQLLKAAQALSKELEGLRVTFSTATPPNIGGQALVVINDIIPPLEEMVQILQTMINNTKIILEGKTLTTTVLQAVKLPSGITAPAS